tara:strand:- start:217 stop:441 length:225 start_codon:yes stop_codon:yes gene_type:complete
MTGSTGNRSTKMNKEPDYTVNLTIEDVRLLHHCVIKRIEMWEGSPARPPEEQEHLWYMRDSLYRMMLDYQFNNL